MNWLDIVILVLLIVSVIGGMMNGLIKAVFGLAGLIIAVVLSGRFYVWLADHMSFISSPDTARVVAFIIIFLVICIIATILGVIFTKMISTITLGWLNRLLGGVFGVLIGGICIGVILALLVKYTGIGDVVGESALGTFLVDKLPIVLGLLPAEFDSIKNFLD